MIRRVQDRANAVPSVDPFVIFHLDRYVRPGDLMLDVGCGPAPYRGAVKGRYVGLDITAASYSSTMRRWVDVVAAGDSLPFPADVFDFVFSKSAFFIMPNHERALSEFRRVLKPAGRLLLVDYNRRTQRRLQATEGTWRPCWTQWKLRALVRRAGFRRTELRAPLAREMGTLERVIRPVLQEWFGTWAIVSAVK